MLTNDIGLLNPDTAPGVFLVELFWKNEGQPGHASKVSITKYK